MRNKHDKCKFEGESWDEQLLLTSTKARESATANNGAANWESVKRAVSASEPPRVSDIGAHCKFIQKYAGHAHQHLDDMLDYLDVAMPEGRIVSGNTFSIINGLKFTPTEMMPRFMHACIIVQACGTKSREHVGLTISEGQLKSIQNQKKSLALKAEMTIKKGYELIAKVPRVQKNLATTAVGKLQKDLVHFVLELSNLEYDRQAYTTIDDISKAFLEHMIGIDPQHQTQSKSKAEVDTITAIKYTADGGNNAGQVTVSNLGFKVGDIIEHRKTQDAQFKIVYVNDDGSAGVARIDSHGEPVNTLTNMTMDTLISDHRHAKHKIELYDGYPENTALDSDEFNLVVQRGAVVFAIKRLAANTGYSIVTFRLQKYPTSRVFALESVRAGKLRVVPVTHKFGDLVEKKEIVASLHVFVDGAKMMINRNVSDTSLCEFFVMRTASDKKDANMQIEWFEELVKVDTDTSIAVKVPCAVNFEDVAADTEIVLYKPATKTVAAKQKGTNVVLESAKKAKTAE